MGTYDLVIKNGLVVDGLGNPRQRTDVAIAGERIAKVGRVADADAEGARVLDATGLIVAPGFIDLHTHYDAQVIWDPYLTTSGWHGVTSVVTGNCGFGFAPVQPELRERSMLSMTAVESIPTESMAEGMPWDWVSFPDYLDSVDRTPKAVNILPYVPLNPLLIWVLGLEGAKAGRLPTDEEHAELARLLHEALAAGGCGWSAQCLGKPGETDARLPQGDFDGSPMPTDVMWPQTRRILAEVLGERGMGFMQASGISNEECEELVERSGRPLVWQAVVANSKTNRYKGAMEWIQDCQRRGLPIYGQAMTTDAPIAFSLGDDAVLRTSPLAQVHAAAGLDAKLAVLSDATFRDELHNWPANVFSDFADMVLLSTTHPDHVADIGRSVGAIAGDAGVRPIDLMCDLTVADRMTTLFQTQQFAATREGLKELVDDPYLIPGLSDGGAHVSFLSSGCYGTEYIAKYVREYEFTTLEQAHRRLSGLPAHCAGFTDRGSLREGQAADVIVYDYDTLDYLPPEFAHDLPGGQSRAIIRSQGYAWTIVNGEITIDHDQHTDAMAGRLLRHGQPTS